MVNREYQIVEKLNSKQFESMFSLYKKSRGHDDTYRGEFTKIIEITDIFSLLSENEHGVILFSRMVFADDDSLHIVEIIDGYNETGIMQVFHIIDLIIHHERFEKINKFKYFCPLKMLPLLNFTGLKFMVDESFENISVINISR